MNQKKKRSSTQEKGDTTVLNIFKKKTSHDPGVNSSSISSDQEGNEVDSQQVLVSTYMDWKRGSVSDEMAFRLLANLSSPKDALTMNDGV